MGVRRVYATRLRLWVQLCCGYSRCPKYLVGSTRGSFGNQASDMKPYSFEEKTVKLYIPPSLPPNTLVYRLQSIPSSNSPRAGSNLNCLQVFNPEAVPQCRPESTPRSLHRNRTKARDSFLETQLGLQSQATAKGLHIPNFENFETLKQETPASSIASYRTFRCPQVETAGP